MTRKLKKTLAMVLSLMIILSLFAGLNITSCAINSTMWFSAEQKVGYIYLSAYSCKDLNNMAIIDYDLKFDNNVLEYVSAETHYIPDHYDVSIGKLIDSENTVAVVYVGSGTCEIPADELLYTVKFKIKDFSKTTTKFNLTARDIWSQSEDYLDYYPQAAVIGINIKKPDIADYIEYEVYDNYVKITGCDESITGDIEIPAEIESKPVTSIDDSAFYGCTSLTSITIPDGVTSIEFGVFFGCTSLKSITIPDSVTYIDERAFDGCNSLTDITIPNSVTCINERAFRNCTSLSSITIPDSVTSIGYDAFSECTSLASITIPDSVTSIGGGAFYNTAYSENESNWENGMLYIGNHLIRQMEDISGEYKIKYNTKTIADYALAHNESLTSIIIPDSVTSVGANAFYGCTSLTSITIPDSVTSIGQCAFSDTAYYNNESNRQNGVLYIGNCLIDAKDDISGEYSIKDGTRIIADKAFWLCTSLTKITLPDSITTINNNAFVNCFSLTSAVIPSNVKYIGEHAFGYKYYDGKYVGLIDGFTIYGEPGTEAERYANENGITFIAIENSCKHETVELRNVFAETCTADGYTGDKYCTKCGEKLETGISIPATGHCFGEWTVVKPATDTAEGLERRTCSVCGAKEEKTIPVTGTVVPGEITFVDNSIKLDNDNMIATIGDKTTVDKFNSLVETGNIKIVDKDGKALDAKTTIGTGCVVQSLDDNGNVVSAYTVLVPCDIDGNGKITAADARLALRISAKLENITGVYRTAADFDGDGNVKNADARSILRKSINLI